MCGRYGFIASGFKTWGLQDELPGFKDNYNATPGSFLPVLKTDSPLHAELMKWGLVPHWSKTATVKFSTINARAETVQTNPAFKDSFFHRRCLVPCLGFYEWRKNADGTKTPFFIHLTNQPFFAMAGIWDYWTDVEGKQFKSYAIITTAANSLMKPIHSRMPVILAKADEAAWVEPLTPGHQAFALLKPFDSTQMDVYQISSQVNNPRNNSKSLLQPTSNRLAP